MLMGGGTCCIGGYGYATSSVETVDLRDGSCTLEQTPLPFANSDSIGVVDRDGNPMSCGGNFADDPKQCVLYDKAADQWLDGPAMNFDRDYGATSVSLADGRYFVIGSRDTEG